MVDHPVFFCPFCGTSCRPQRKCAPRPAATKTAPTVQGKDQQMAATFNFELVTPERLVFSRQTRARSLCPGAEGDFAVLAGHSPFISTLRPGILEVTLAAGPACGCLVKKGVAEADPERLTVLAQSAVPIEEFDGARLASELQARRGAGRRGERR